MKIKAITIDPAWAWAIAHSTKRAENRTWKINYRGLIAIHAGVNRSREKRARESMARLGVQVPDELVRGHVVAVAELVECLPLEEYRERYGRDGWACGPYVWRLENVRRIEPIRMRGSQGLFECRIPEFA